MQKRKSHSKFKNTGILFELLAKQVTADIIAGHDASPARDLMSKYFKEGTELGQEFNLYSILLNEKLKDETHADRLLSACVNNRKRLNDKRLSELKYNLIKEIKEKYPIDEMLKAPVRNYRVLASIYKAFEDAVSPEVKFDVKEVYSAKNCIVEHICDKPRAAAQTEDELLSYYHTQTEDIRLLTYKLLVEKFNEKYSSVLDDEQKSVLHEYICNVANTNQFDKFVKGKVSEIKQNLNELITKVKEADVVKIKIREVVNQLDKINPDKVVKDNHVTVLMLSYELLKEVKKQVEAVNAK